MAKSNKKNKSSSIIIIIAILVVAIFVFLILNKGDIKSGSGDSSGGYDLESFASICTSYAMQSLRAEFCKYALVEEELINCADPRISQYLATINIDYTLPALNCRNIDNYSFRKTACETLASGKPGTKIAGQTCADYL